MYEQKNQLINKKELFAIDCITDNQETIKIIIKKKIFLFLNEIRMKQRNITLFSHVQVPVVFIYQDKSFVDKNFVEVET